MLKAFILQKVATYDKEQIFYIRKYKKYFCERYCGIQGNCPEVVGTLMSMPPRGEGFLGGSLATSKLKGGL